MPSTLSIDAVDTHNLEATHDSVLKSNSLILRGLLIGLAACIITLAVLIYLVCFAKKHQCASENVGWVGRLATRTFPASRGSQQAIRNSNTHGPSPLPSLLADVALATLTVTPTEVEVMVDKPQAAAARWLQDEVVQAEAAQSILSYRNASRWKRSSGESPQGAAARWLQDEVVQAEAEQSILSYRLKRPSGESRSGKTSIEGDQLHLAPSGLLFSEVLPQIVRARSGSCST